MELKDVLSELVTFIKISSPEMWRILVKQVYVTIFQSALGVIVSSVVALVLYKLTKKVQDNDWDSFDMSLVLIFSWIGIVIGIIVAICFLSTAISMLINPEFYAIRFLIGAI